MNGIFFDDFATKNFFEEQETSINFFIFFCAGVE